MRFHHVCLESIGYCLPDERVTSDQIERRLQAVYHRLRLPAGRLEMMTGIRERRFWAPGRLPSEMSVCSGRAALAAAGIHPDRVRALVHASVCRDWLEPATACRVHDRLALPAECHVYDLSNACLGLVNGIIQIANMIELGQIRAGLVVGSEGSRQLIETTIQSLNSDQTLTRQSIKPALASLTIGSASAAVLLVHRSLSRSKTEIHTAVAQAHTRHHALCQSGRDDAVAVGMQPLMETQSEALLHAGNQAARATFDQFLSETGWGPDQVDKTICHQVGAAHQRSLLETLRIPPERDFATFPWLGNTGSVALPLTVALAAQNGHLAAGDRVGLLGIGSGINCLMVGVVWHRLAVAAASEWQGASGEWQD